MTSGWIAVDLDGTMAHYNSGDGVAKIGAPIMVMVNRVRRWISEGREVRIFTARVAQGEVHEIAHQRRMIEDWSERIVGKRLVVTCIKDFQMDELYDDRCVAVEPNTGKLLSPSRRGLDERPALHKPAFTL